MAVDPNLPFSRVTVPRLTRVVPFEQFNGIIQSEYTLSHDFQIEKAGFVDVRHPHVDVFAVRFCCNGQR